MSARSEFGSSSGSSGTPILTRTQANITTEGSPIVVTRPNDTTAYAQGDVFGAAVDARITLPIPAPPSGPAGAAYYLISLSFLAVRSGANLLSTSPTLQPFVLFFQSQPATVIADNAPLALSDADIALLIRQTSPLYNTSFTSFGASSNCFNYGPAGKIRMGSFLNSVAPTEDYGAVGGNVSGSWPTNTNVYMYWYFQASFTPTAEETVTIVPRFNWAVTLES